MQELAKNFIGKEVIIYTFNGSQIEGIIKEIAGSAALVESAKGEGGVQAVNLEYVLRIREYPRDKKGKKKALILD